MLFLVHSSNPVSLEGEPWIRRVLRSQAWRTLDQTGSAFPGLENPGSDGFCVPRPGEPWIRRVLRCLENPGSDGFCVPRPGEPADGLHVFLLQCSSSSVIPESLA
ncbi:unnamed protein product [Boreogadus saida]